MACRRASAHTADVKRCVHTRFPWHQASPGPSQHTLTKGILAYQTESGPAGQKGQSRKEKWMRSGMPASDRCPSFNSLVMAEASQAVVLSRGCPLE